MSFEGKKCGVCNKGTLHAYKDEVAAGVHVDAYKDEHGHIAYTEEVMRTVEKIYKNTAEERHLVRVGSSVAVPIPAAIVKLLELKPKEKVYITTQDNRIIIRPSPV